MPSELTELSLASLAAWCIHGLLVAPLQELFLFLLQSCWQSLRKAKSMKVSNFGVELTGCFAFTNVLETKLEVLGTGTTLECSFPFGLTEVTFNSCYDASNLIFWGSVSLSVYNSVFE